MTIAPSYGNEFHKLIVHQLCKMKSNSISFCLFWIRSWIHWVSSSFSWWISRDREIVLPRESSFWTWTKGYAIPPCMMFLTFLEEAPFTMQCCSRVAPDGITLKPDSTLEKFQNTWHLWPLLKLSYLGAGKSSEELYSTQHRCMWFLTGLCDCTAIAAGQHGTRHLGYCRVRLCVSVLAPFSISRKALLALSCLPSCTQVWKGAGNYPCWNVHKCAALIGHFPNLLFKKSFNKFWQSLWLLKLD